MSPGFLFFLFLFLIRIFEHYARIVDIYWLFYIWRDFGWKGVVIISYIENNIIQSIVITRNIIRSIGVQPPDY
jgi:hypothetical protein